MPAPVLTVGQLRAQGARVFTKCQRCEQFRETDLAAIIAARGPDVVLMNRAPPCRACSEGRVFFYAQHGQRITRQTTEAFVFWLGGRR